MNNSNNCDIFIILEALKKIGFILKGILIDSSCFFKYLVNLLRWNWLMTCSLSMFVLVESYSYLKLYINDFGVKVLVMENFKKWYLDFKSYWIGFCDCIAIFSFVIKKPINFGSYWIGDYLCPFFSSYCHISFDCQSGLSQMFFVL